MMQHSILASLDIPIKLLVIFFLAGQELEGFGLLSLL